MIASRGHGDEMIRGCTSLIQLRRQKGHDLSSIYNNRGVGYEQIGDSEKALDPKASQVQREGNLLQLAAPSMKMTPSPRPRSS